MTSDGISETRLREIVAYLASDELEGRGLGTEGGRKAREYIVEALRSMEVDPGGEDGYLQEIRAGAGTNILGLLEAEGDLREEYVIVSAHYDHLGKEGDRVFNGADDNASAVAILLEVARALVPLREQLRRSVIIASWDGEEPPYFRTPAMGSRYWVENPTVPLDSVSMMFGMDLMGSNPWKGWEGRLFLLGGEKCAGVDQVIDGTPDVEGLRIGRLGIHMIENIPVYGHLPVSDYDPFRNREVPFLFLTCGRPADYHQDTDIPEKLDYVKMRRMSEYLLSATMMASRFEGTFRFDGEREDHLRDAREMQEGLDCIFGVEDPKTAFPGYSSLAWTALRGWRPKVARILDRLEAGKPARPREVRLLEKASLAVQTLSTRYRPF